VLNTLTALKLEGDMVKATVKGTAEGSIQFTKAVIDGRSLAGTEAGSGKKAPAGASFKAHVDTARERPLQVEMKKPTGLVMFKNGKSAALPNEPFDIWIERPAGGTPRVGTANPEIHYRATGREIWESDWSRAQRHQDRGTEGAGQGSPGEASAARVPLGRQPPR
jgi:hypothetical protein